MKLRPAKTAAEIDTSLTTDGGARGRNRTQIRTVTVTVPASRVEQAIARLSRNPAVERVTRPVKMTLSGAPNDPSYAQQWALPKIAWDQANGVIAIPGSATIAVLDTGINAAHPDLAGRVVTGVSFTGGNPNIDPHGHGTLLAGIAAANTNNAAGIAGVGYAGVNVASVQVLQADGTADDADVVDGVLWAADNGAKVILMGFSSPDYSPALADAIDYAWSRGVTLVAATGNSGAAAVTYPSGMPHVLGVASTTQSDTLAPSSNFGSANVAAPGVGILTTTAAGGYASISGTSAAVAHVAGEAALLAASGKPNTYIYDQIRWASAPIAGQTFGRINVKTALGAALTGPAWPARTAPPAGPSRPTYNAAVGTLQNVTLVASSLANGAVGTTWTITFTPQTALSVQDHVDIKFPAGFTLPADIYDPTGPPGVAGTSIGSGFKAGTFVYQIIRNDPGGAPNTIEMDLYTYSGAPAPEILDTGVTASISIVGVTNGTGPFNTGDFEIWTSQDQVVKVNPISITDGSAGPPGVPTGISITPGSQQLSVAFTTPVSDGGSAITTYQYSTDGGTTWLTRQTGTTASPLVITTLSTNGTTALTNGVTYPVQIRAVNGNGNGTATASTNGTPSGVPGAPTSLVVTPTNQQLSVAFTAPVSNGGSAITTYQYSTDGGTTWLTRQAGTTASPVVITTLSTNGTTPLANGTTYPVQLRAVNANGNGPATASTNGTPATTAGAATGVSITPGSQQLSVAFTPPVSDGGAAITTYQYSTDGGVTWLNRQTGTGASPLVITTLSTNGTTPLTNGVTYPVQIRPVNSQGNGTATASVNGTPTGVPGAPTGLGVTPANQQLSVAFTAPVSDGGSAITTYQYSTDGGVSWLTRQTGTTGSPLVITTLSTNGTTPLSNGTTYPIQLRAVNANGNGAATASTNGTPATTAGAASGVVITPGNQQLSVAFTVPVSDGGAAITTYQYSTDGGTTWLTRQSGTNASPLVITTLSTNGTTPLTNGVTYPVQIRAVNSQGNGTATASVNGTPAGVPGAPTGLVVTEANQQLSVAFTPPVSDGGSAITTYQYSTDGGVSWLTRQTGTTASPLVITTLSTNGTTALTNGTTYPIQLRAVNVNGSGPATASTNATPATTAGAATSVVITPSSQQLSVAFTAPVSDGGTAVTSYQYSTDGGVTWLTRQTGTTASPLVITTLSTNGTTALTNGVTYPVRIRALNAQGSGAATASVNGMPVGVPSAPTGLVVTPGNLQLSVAFTAPVSNGGSAITMYQYSTDGGVTWLNRQTGTTASPLVITTLSTNGTTALTNGVVYPIQLRAVNVHGNGPATASTNGTPALVPPVALSGMTSTDGSQIIITFDKPMSDPAAFLGQFSSPGRVFTAAALGSPATQIILTLATPIASGELVSVTYTAPGVTSTDGAALATFTWGNVTNAVPAPGGGGGGGGGLPSAPVAPTVQDNLNNPVPGLDPVSASISGGAGSTVVTALVVNVRNDGPDERQTTVTISVPPGAVPGTERIVVQSVSTISALLGQAPMPPTQGKILSAVSAQVFNANNVAIKTEFARPVAITATIPPAAVPPGALASNFTMAFWDSVAWVEIPSRAAIQADGSVRVDADVTHFTLYAVKYRGVRGYVAPAVYGSGTIGAVVFQPGGSFEELIVATRRENAAAVWAQDDRGIYHLLIIDGPEFLKAEFYAAFPNGFPNFHAMTVVKQAGRNEASPEAPDLGAPSVAAPRPAPPQPVTPSVRTGTSNGAAAGTQRYTVTAADTLSDIALRFGIDWMAIANANGITGPNYFVRPGQVLTIPAGGKGTRTHTVSGAETLSGIGALYGVSWPQIAAINGIAGPNYFVRPGQVLTIPNP